MLDDYVLILSPSQSHKNARTMMSNLGIFLPFKRVTSKSPPSTSGASESVQVNNSALTTSDKTYSCRFLAIDLHTRSAVFRKSAFTWRNIDNTTPTEHFVSLMTYFARQCTMFKSPVRKTSFYVLNVLDFKCNYCAHINTTLQKQCSVASYVVNLQIINYMYYMGLSKTLK